MRRSHNNYDDNNNHTYNYYNNYSNNYSNNQKIILLNLLQQSLQRPSEPAIAIVIPYLANRNIVTVQSLKTFKISKMEIQGITIVMTDILTHFGRVAKL